VPVRFITYILAEEVQSREELVKQTFRSGSLLRRGKDMPKTFQIMEIASALAQGRLEGN
jgi:hypothetical protein